MSRTCDLYDACDVNVATYLWNNLWRDIENIRPQCDPSLIQPFLRTNSLYEKPTVVFSPHTPCGRVRLARFALEDHAYGAFRRKRLFCSLSVTEDGFRTCLGFLIWHVSSWIGQSAIYVENLSVNTQIVKRPLQVLLLLPSGRPLAIQKRKTHTESLFAG